MISATEKTRIANALASEVRAWVLRGFEPRFGKLSDRFEANPRWQALQRAGTELWLDSGDVEASRRLWTREMRALTTNNTLLNKEVQRGQYDDLVRETAAHLRKLEPSIPEDLLVSEIGFVLNAHHGLRLVETFDAFVSVEEHTDLATDIDLAVLYGKRFYAICPERFFVKLPMTPEGLLAMRRLRKEGVPINFTLGFSARQNYLAARVGDPTYANVFLGRLNSFVADSKLGTGNGVGEKATAASQEALTELRARGTAHTRQIAASMRSGEQVWTLAGVDVMTMPLAVAEGYAKSAQPPVAGRGPVSADFQPDVDAKALRSLHFETLWDVPQSFRNAVEGLVKKDLDHMAGAELATYMRQNGAADIFPEYSTTDIDTIRKDGKIPNLERWRARLESGAVGLDSLFNASALQSFATDQKALDDRIRGLLG